MPEFQPVREQARLQYRICLVTSGQQNRIPSQMQVCGILLRSSSPVEKIVNVNFFDCHWNNALFHILIFQLSSSHIIVLQKSLSSEVNLSKLQMVMYNCLCCLLIEKCCWVVMHNRKWQRNFVVVYVMHSSCSWCRINILLARVFWQIYDAKKLKFCQNAINSELYKYLHEKSIQFV